MSDAAPPDRFSAARWQPRPAVPADNAGLIALAEACPMEGEISLCVNRSPDFFALSRLEGKQWRVAVVDAADGTLAGCIGIAERRAYLQGAERQVMYVGDLKVHPDHRGSGAGEALIRHAWQACREIGGDDVPTLITVLGGNAAMERRAEGLRGIPPWTRFARLKAHSVSLLWKRKVPAIAGMRAERALAGDFAAMEALWRRLAPARHFAPAFDRGGFEAWIAQAPGSGRIATGCCAGRTVASPPSWGSGTRRCSSRPAWCAIRALWRASASSTTCSAPWSGPRACPAPGVPCTT